MTFEQYQTDSETLQRIIDAADHDLQRIIEGKRNAMGLVSNSCRDSKEFIKAKQAYELAAGNLRRLNTIVGAKFLKKYHAWKKAQK